MVKNIMLWGFMIMICFSCTKKLESNEVLFVCTHGAARSPIAAAYFNKLASENNLNYHAVYRGIVPDKDLTTETKIGLSQDGFIIDEWQTKLVTATDIEKAHTTVTFDCTLPQSKSTKLVEEWNNTPSISEDYNIARDAIKGKIERMINQILEE